jgi:hypothetical protein
VFLAHHVHDNKVGAHLSSEVGIPALQLECIDEETTATPEEIVAYSPLPTKQQM